MALAVVNTVFNPANFCGILPTLLVATWIPVKPGFKSLFSEVFKSDCVILIRSTLSHGLPCWDAGNTSATVPDSSCGFKTLAKFSLNTCLKAKASPPIWSPEASLDCLWKTSIYPPAWLNLAYEFAE